MIMVMMMMKVQAFGTCSDEFSCISSLIRSKSNVWLHVIKISAEIDSCCVTIALDVGC
jgi:hypothetical protein